MLSIFLTFTFVMSALKKRLELEDKLAKDIQQGLLPNQFPKIQGFGIYGLYEPANIVGGDYYDVIIINENMICFCIGDVIGHGIPAALLMSNLQAAVRRTAMHVYEPKELCSQVNNFVIDNLAEGKFITFFCGILNIKNKTYTYTNAGHNPPILCHDNGTTVRLTNDGFMLGIEHNFKYQQEKVQLLYGDTLLHYTDGATEIKNAWNEDFGEERLIDIVKNSRSFDASNICNKTLQAILHY
jgi:sigma-B regulation protein RsbU (phosphoserine phosphatase)